VNQNLARAIGPAIGGVILAATSAGILFLINAATFIAVIAVIAWWHGSQVPQFQALRRARLRGRELRHRLGGTRFRPATGTRRSGTAGVRWVSLLMIFSSRAGRAGALRARKAGVDT
jgi:Transmembrane secretion effector